MKPLTLHAHDTGPNPYKVAILLEALKLPYNVRLWEFGDGHNGVKGPVFLKINENGPVNPAHPHPLFFTRPYWHPTCSSRVPALEDPNIGIVSWESGAVINYLLRNYDKSNAFGPGSSEQDKVDFDKWTFFLLSSLGLMTGQTNWYRHYNEVKNEDALKRYVAQTYRTYDVLEGQLKKSSGESLLETGYGAEDKHFYPWVFQHEYAGLDIAKYPMMKRWLERVGNTPEVKAAYEKIPKGEHV
jgi:glutathione S-transferase